MLKKPFAWYGGKEALASTLVSLLPEHKVYCEVFGGSGALLFAKEPSSLEVFNDLDSGVVNFFQVLRNPQQAAELQRLLSLTPYSREEYYDCLKHWEASAEPVEKARAWYCAVMQSMNSSIRNTGWSSTKTLGSNPARAWTNSITNLAACVGRLAHVQVDHRDFEQVIRAYDGPATCFYLDPPYLSDTRRKQRCYHHEMSGDDHKRLLACMQEIQGMVLLSGYAHPLYQEALASWECVTLTLRCSSAVRAHAASSEVLPEMLTRTEYIWMNAACVRHQKSHQQSLFQEGRYSTFVATSLCPSCQRTFAGIVAFDAHRTGTFSQGKRRCLTEEEMRVSGMVQNEKGWWAVPSNFGREKMKNEEGGSTLLPQSLGKLVPFGYAAKDADQRLAELMHDEKAVLVDIRYNAVSRWRPQWNGKALREAWSGRYFPLSALGNVNYNNDGPIKIFMPDIGIPLLVEELQKGYTLILLCACKEYETCHRKIVCELVKASVPGVEIYHAHQSQKPLCHEN